MSSCGVGKEEETRWTDDSIRWNPEDLDAEKAAEDEADAAAAFDPFKDPDPTETFSYRFHRPHSGSTCGKDENDDCDHLLASEQSLIEIELRGFKADSDEIWKSTGLTLWRASEHLCNYMVQNSEFLDGKRILELGSGLGLCGILAQKMTTGSDVCLTDGDTEALVYLRENVDRNRLKDSGSAANTDACAASKISCRQLLWGRDTSLQFLDRYAEGKTYDIILASDIIYVEVIVEPLWETIQTLLSPSGTFILAFAKRKVPISIDFVLSSADAKGFCHKRVEHDNDGIFLYTFQFRDSKKVSADT